MPPKKKPKYVLEMEAQLKSLSDMFTARFGDQTSATGGPETSSESSAPPPVPAAAAARSLRSGKQRPKVLLPAESTATKGKKRAPATVSKPPQEEVEVGEDQSLQRHGEDAIVDQQSVHKTGRDLVTLDRETIASTIQDVVGEVEEVSEGDCLNPYLLAGTTLDIKIKRKIFAGEFVDLVTLAPREELPSYSFFTFSNNNNANNSKPKQPGNFIEWMRLFMIYASIYGSKYPDQCVPMYSYVLRIYGLSTRQPVSYA